MNAMAILRVGLLPAAGLMAAVVMSARTERLEVPRPTRVIASNQFVLSGEVTERTDNSFTLLSRTSELTTLLVTTDTSITKAAATIKLADLFVGDFVSVMAIRSANGRLVAVEVKVRTPTE